MATGTSAATPSNGGGPHNELVALQHTLYESRNPTRRWLHCARRDWIIAAISRVKTPSRRAAMEVGPGSGVYLPALAHEYREVAAVDVEQAYLTGIAPLLARHPNLRAIADDITASGLPSESFDLVLCTEVLEHIPASDKALRELFRVLKPGGALIASTPQRYSPLELACKVAFLPGVIDVVRLVYREPVLETGHVNLMTERRFRGQLVDAGFLIEEGYKSGLYLPLLAEFGGVTGLKVAQRLEKALWPGRMDWLLWTQYFIARKP